MKTKPQDHKPPLHVPPRRLIALLAVGMLAIGVALGAAVGPAPSPSLANPDLRRLLGPLVGISAARRAQAAAAGASAQPPSSAPEAAVAEKKPRHRHKLKRPKTDEEPSTVSSESTLQETTKSTPTTPKSTAKETETPLAPVTKVWLIELSGSSFGAAAAQSAAVPYIEGQAIPAGTLLSGWSALQASAFASDAALLAGEAPQLLDTITQPPCPEGSAGAQCAPGSAGALTAADEFLKATLPSITSQAAYKESGLVVVTFASIANATATGLPAGAATATLTSTEPAGALVISPFARAGAASSATFDPTSPKRSLKKLLRR